MNNQTGNNTVSSDFLRVLLALKSNIMKDCNVSEVCIVNAKEDDVYLCSPINDRKTTVYCHTLQNLDLRINDIVLVIFTNTDFRQNLKRFKANQQFVDISNDSTHSLNHGIVIGLIYRKEN